MQGVQVVRREGGKRNPSSQVQWHEACERGWLPLERTDYRGAVSSEDNGVLGRARP